MKEWPMSTYWRISFRGFKKAKVGKQACFSPAETTGEG